MALEAPQQGGQCRGMARLVVEPPEQDVFKAHPPARDRHVAAAILQQLLDRIGVGGGDQFLPQPLIRGMEAHRQGELGAAQPIEGPLGQGGQGSRHAHGAHRDLALGHAQVAAEAVDRGKHHLAVEKGFAHAHEHHMAGAAAHGLAHAQYLVDDLVHGKGALQPSLARGAEAAGHRTAHLATHAHGEPLTAGNPHGFDAQAINGAEQQLAGTVAGVTAVQHPGAAQQGLAGFALPWGDPLLSGALWTPLRWWPKDLRLGPSGP